MRPPIRALAGALLAATCVHPSVADTLSVAERGEDLRYLVDRIRAIHPDPFAHVSDSAFTAQVDSLRFRLGELSDVAWVVELQRLVARLGDGHSTVRLASAGPAFDRQYPIVMYPFEEGVYVTGANAAYARIVGGRVVRIGALPLDEALARIRSVIGGENAFTLLDRIPNALTSPPILYALGISPDAERVEIEVVEPDGSTRTARITPVAADAFTFVGPEVVSPGAVRARATDPPLTLRYAGETNAFEYVPGENLLYVAFNQVRNAPEESLRAFFERVFAVADSTRIETFVLDLRYNHGGNNQLLRPLVHGLIRREGSINRPGHFFAVIGRGTFSAAVSCTAWLEEHTNVRFVGEPTASGPNHFGDPELLTLPASGIHVYVSAWRWQTRLPWDDRPWFAPSLAASPTFADYVAGRDAALQIIRAGDDAWSIGDVLQRALDASGTPGLRAAYATYRAAHPDRWGVTTEAAVNDLGYRLLADEATEAAIAVFTLNTESYPEHANAWDSLAEGTLHAGDRNRAIALYEKALEVDPEFTNARRMLAELTGATPPEDH